jgi:tRNA U54 and U55 pseudouridine synthase Pus10
MENNNETICDICKYIFKNAKLINTNDDTGYDEVQDKIEKDLQGKYTDDDCKFCFGIFNKENFSFIISQINEKVKEYELNDYKISTSFSPLFSLIHSYVKFTIYLFYYIIYSGLIN